MVEVDVKVSRGPDLQLYSCNESYSEEDFVSYTVYSDVVLFDIQSGWW